MIVYIYGPDTFRSREYARESVKKFKEQRDPQGYNVVFLDGKKETSGAILTELATTPFLAERRLIMVDNILSSSNKELLGELLKKIKEKRIAESNIVIFWQGEPISKVKEAKELEKVLREEKYAREFVELSGAKLTTWIQQAVKEGGGSIAPNATTYLAQQLVGDMWQLHSVIGQLIAYTNRGEITIKDVELFIEEKIDDNIFNMIAAVSSGNKKQAFILLNEQRRRGEEEGKIFGLFVWQFRILLEMSDLLEHEPGLTSEAIARETGLHPFAVKKNLSLVKKYSLANLQRVYQELLTLDHQTKTGQADRSLLIDLLVAKI